MSVGANLYSGINTINVTNFSKGRVVAYGSGNFTLRVQAYSKGGYRIGLPTASLVEVSGATQYVKDFDLRGIESVSVWAQDSTNATNTITIDLGLSQN